MEEYIVRVYENRTEWLQYDKLHRTNGPAVEYNNGRKYWYLNGHLHRTDGPAIEYPNGTNEWWIEGKRYTEKDFQKKISPVVEMTVDEISEKLGFTVKVVGEK